MRCSQPGVAAAEAIKAGDEGRQAALMGIGVAVERHRRIVQDSDVRLRIAFIGDSALSMFGVGLLLRGYST